MPLRAVIFFVTYVALAQLARFAVRRFVREQGGKVNSWMNRSFAIERRSLRKLTDSREAVVARRARRYLRLAIVEWWSFFPFVALMIWATATR